MGAVTSTADEQPLISVVVPVYQTERYLAACLDSLLGQQDAPSFEVVAVDDGSTDGSPATLAGYAADNPGLRVLSCEHAGVSAARNLGLSASRGIYVLFLDSDDRLSPDALSILGRIVTDTDGIDLVYYAGRTDYESKDLEKRYPWYEDAYTIKGSYPGIMSGPDLFRALMRHGDYQPNVCKQLLSRRHIDNAHLHFIEGLAYEDNLFTLESMLCSKQASCIPDQLYIRHLRPGSIMTSTPSVSDLRSALEVYAHAVAFIGTVDVSASDDPQGFRETLGLDVSRLRDQVLHIYRRMPSAERGQTEGLPTEDAILLAQLLKEDGCSPEAPAEDTEPRTHRTLLDRLLGR